MAVFKKILVPYDGSQVSNSAAEKAIAIAADQGAELVGLKVIAFEGELVAPSDRLWATIIEDLEQKGRDILDEFESTAKAKGVNVSLEVKVGYVEEEIVSVANKIGVDLVVMGVGEKIGMHRVSIRRLVKEAPCPVMITH